MSTSDEPVKPESRPDIRIGDREREQTVGHLGTAFGEGRLDLAEYDERVAAAYAAKTAGDLFPLTVDLPLAVRRTEPTPAGSTRDAAPERAPAKAHQRRHPAQRSADEVDRPMPGWLRAIWLVYATVVSINLVVWLLVSISNGEPVYFWPMWVAGPWGVVLLFRTFGDRLAGPGR